MKERRTRFLFLADMQLGAYASVSGLDQTVVIGGDMVDDNDSPEQLDAVFSIAGDLDEEIPLYWVPGNHDIATNTVVPTRHSIDKYRESFGRDYYSFEFGTHRFIVLNTVVLDHPEEVPGELDEQMEFLQFELSRTAPGRGVVFGHHPLFLHTPGEEDSYWNLPLERRTPLLQLIHRHRVPVAFAGHWHRNSIAFDGKFQMVTTGPVGVPMGPDPSGLRVVDLEEQGVEHQYRPLAEPAD